MGLDGSDKGLNVPLNTPNTSINGDSVLGILSADANSGAAGRINELGQAIESAIIPINAESHRIEAWDGEIMGIEILLIANPAFANPSDTSINGDRKENRSIGILIIA